MSHSYDQDARMSSPSENAHMSEGGTEWWMSGYDSGHDTPLHSEQGSEQGEDFETTVTEAHVEAVEIGTDDMTAAQETYERRLTDGSTHVQLVAAWARLDIDHPDYDNTPGPCLLLPPSPRSNDRRRSDKDEGCKCWRYWIGYEVSNTPPRPSRRCTYCSNY